MTPGSVVVGYLDNGTWSACFGLSLRDLMLRDAATSGRIVRKGGRELRAVTPAGQVAANRNKVAADFLSTDGEWLFMVDTDMGFAPDTVDRLVAAADPKARPVVGGLCFGVNRIAEAPFHGERFRVRPTVYEWDDGDEPGFRPVLDYPRDRLVRVDGTGAACLLVHRGVLERLRSIGDGWFDPISLGGHRFSEDLSFCLRLRELGIPLHVDTGVKTTHHKGSVYLDEAVFDGAR